MSKNHKRPNSYSGGTQESQQEMGTESLNKRVPVGNSSFADSNDESNEESSADSATGSDLQSQIRPAVSQLRGYVEGRPARAIALGALGGGLLGWLLSNEQGRSVVKSAFGYAKPMLTNYAREIVAKEGSSERGSRGKESLN